MFAFISWGKIILLKDGIYNWISCIFSNLGEHGRKGENLMWKHRGYHMSDSECIKLQSISKQISMQELLSRHLGIIQCTVERFLFMFKWCDAYFGKQDLNNSCKNNFYDQMSIHKWNHSQLWSIKSDTGLVWLEFLS